jgi:hypothetical protein
LIHNGCYGHRAGNRFLDADLGKATLPALPDQSHFPGLSGMVSHPQGIEIHAAGKAPGIENDAVCARGLNFVYQGLNLSAQHVVDFQEDMIRGLD